MRSLALFSAFVAAIEEKLSFDAEEAKAVGSPVRLRQMLSLFFEAFGVVCGRDLELMASATDEVLSVISQGWKAWGSARAKKKGSRG